MFGSKRRSIQSCGGTRSYPERATARLFGQVALLEIRPTGVVETSRRTRCNSDARQRITPRTLPLVAVVLTAHPEGVSLVPIRLFPPVVLGVVDLRFEVLVWIDDPTSFWSLVLRDIHGIELREI
jgi:hypothetical protein